MKNELQIPQRLTVIASMIPNGSRVADIGTDHAYLPVFLIRTSVSPYVVAGEVNQGPWERAKQHVCEANLQHRIDVRMGDGLEIVAPGEVDGVVMAGMGGMLMNKMMSEGYEKLRTIRRLVLQPNVEVESVRRWLYDRHWRITEEAILEEEGKFYEVIAAEKAESLRPTEPGEWQRRIRFGPCLLQERSPTFIKKWHREWQRLNQVLQQLERARPDGHMDKKEEVLEKMRMIEEVVKS